MFDVLDVNEATINGRGALMLAVERPRVRNDKHLGTILEWENSLSLPVSDLLHHESLHDAFPDDGVEAYRQAVKRGLKIARRL